MNELRRVGILGTGLIGGSIGLRARELGVHVLGFDADADAARKALERGIVDVLADRREIYASCDTVVLAMPAAAVVAELRSLDRDAAARVPLLIDVASVKAPIVEAAQGVRSFVATHPMAGKAVSGPDSASAALFRDATWAYVPSDDLNATQRAVDFIASMGASAVPIGADLHDEIVAFTSHMPQVFAWVFAERFSSVDDPNAAALCGPVARELLRIGSVQPSMWTDVLDLNAAAVARELRAMAEALEREAADYILKTP